MHFKFILFNDHANSTDNMACSRNLFICEQSNNLISNMNFGKYCGFLELYINIILKHIKEDLF